jgi:NADH:ubiquinone oxidoreductase subunit 6 (subunit J)
MGDINFLLAGLRFIAVWSVLITVGLSSFMFCFVLMNFVHKQLKKKSKIYRIITEEM